MAILPIRHQYAGADRGGGLRAVAPGVLSAADLRAARDEGHHFLPQCGPGGAARDELQGGRRKAGGRAAESHVRSDARASPRGEWRTVFDGARLCAVLPDAAEWRYTRWEKAAVGGSGAADELSPIRGRR